MRIFQGSDHEAKSLNLLIASALLLCILTSARPHADGAGHVDRLQRLAQAGQIDEKAPVKASVEVTVDAPPEKVWALLVDVKAWPKWEPDISRVEPPGQVEPGAAFSWSAGMRIHARIELVKPLEEFAWTGTALHAKAVHIWRLKRLPDGQTMVQVDESMEGFLLQAFYSSAKLEQSDRLWLNYLKKAAER